MVFFDENILVWSLFFFGILSCCFWCLRWVLLCCCTNFVVVIILGNIKCKDKYMMLTGIIHIFLGLMLIHTFHNTRSFFILLCVFHFRLCHAAFVSLLLNLLFRKDMVFMEKILWPTMAVCNCIRDWIQHCSSFLMSCWEVHDY